MAPVFRRESEHKKQVKELERELRKKEKALAEVSALIVLKKKASALWGEDEEPQP